ncbi:TIGR00366 family protein [Bacillus sp. FJAT-49736]|uniref:TIGR00366 family protein n=1 Tax=Bacillus sp. FJAT-49736 TaxID=2833582 RepID=UPI001BC9E2EA|nr:TIGR00366 family protein [Bacillus sp. FJAT-49736]MBS4174212.1 TIGR00366 family protein [Bacillus sp. FJAT-49736]
MVGSVTKFFTKIVERYLPDPLIFAMILTLIVFILSATITPSTPMDVVQMWGDGVWGLLAFSMQMALVLVTGHALASSPLLRKWMGKIASLAHTPTQGVLLVTFMSAFCCIINWGFGLVVGALFAREVARRVPKADYRLLIASAYIGFLTWHGGLSGSVPLSAATAGNPVEKLGGLIPISHTLITPFNIFITAALLVTLPILTKLMMRPENEIVAVDPDLLKEETSTSRKLPPTASIAEKLEESRILAYIIGLLGIVYIIYYFIHHGFDININIVNLIFFIFGIILHGTPMSYMRAVQRAVGGTAGILVQFPFYAGIQIMMEQSGLGQMITNFFIEVSNKDTFPLLTFLSSGIVNLAVPSGGGHWVVQGPYVIPAAQAIGADLGKATMAIAYGEAWMNMAQPFWALPALAIAGLKARDIMGFCITALIYSGIIFVIGLYFF